MRVGVQFYRYGDFHLYRLSWFAQLVGRVTSLYTGYIHVNYRIGNVVYEYTSGGLRYYMVDCKTIHANPSCVITIDVSEEAVSGFITTFVREKRVVNKFWRMMSIGVGGWTGWFPTCSSYGKLLTGCSSRTPDMLFRCLTEMEGRN